VLLRDGSVRNAYTVKILNKHRTAGEFELTVTGIEGIDLRVVSEDEEKKNELDLTGGPDTVTPYRIFVHAPRANLTAESSPLRLTLRDETSGETATYDTVFLGPRR
jgi:hypothetical protein